MPTRAIDPDRLRFELRRLGREELLVLAERAVGLLPQARLPEFVGDTVPPDRLRSVSPGIWLLEEVQRFHASALRGDYYESFFVNSRNCTELSNGTRDFIDDFLRLERECLRVAADLPPSSTRQALELLFELLRRIDAGGDDVLFFADEGGAWLVAVNWRAVLPVYFRALAATAPPAEYATTVDRTIREFVHWDRPRHLATARREASAAQKAALRAVLREEGTRGEPSCTALPPCDSLRSRGRG